MTHSICVTCGTQFAASASPPESCPICSDDRQYVGWGGQAWTTIEEIRAKHRLRFEPEGQGVTGIAIEPHFAIGQRTLLVETPKGNVLWDCVALVDDESVGKIRALGGIAAIAISHPHYYTVMAEWSEAFGGVPIYLHEADRQWVMREHEAIKHWNGDTREILPGLTLIRCGGHFPGGTVLHREASAGRDAALFSGDVIAVNMDRSSVTFMHSFPNYIPLDAAAIRRIAELMAPYRFETIYGAFAKRNVATGGRAAFDRSVTRYLKAIGAV